MEQRRQIGVWGDEGKVGEDGKHALSNRMLWTISEHYLKYYLRTGEMAQSVKFLHYKHKDQHLVPRAPVGTK